MIYIQLHTHQFQISRRAGDDFPGKFTPHLWKDPAELKICDKLMFPPRIPTAKPPDTRNLYFHYAIKSVVESE